MTHYYYTLTVKPDHLTTGPPLLKNNGSDATIINAHLKGAGGKILEIHPKLCRNHTIPTMARAQFVPVLHFLCEGTPNTPHKKIVFNQSQI